MCRTGEYRPGNGFSSYRTTCVSKGSEEDMGDKRTGGCGNSDMEDGIILPFFMGRIAENDRWMTKKKTDWKLKRRPNHRTKQGW